MVVRERMMRVTSKHFFSRRGFSLFVYSLVRLVGKPVERVEPHDLWIRTALHRSTYVLHNHHRATTTKRSSTISRCYQTRSTPDHFHFSATLPTMLPGVPCTNVLYYIGNTARQTIPGSARHKSL